MRGSIRQRAENRWELRVYAGVDITTGTKRWVSRTVRGSRTEAEVELAALADQIDYPRRRALDTTIEQLVTTWYDLASRHWAPNTRRHTRSVIDCHLIPRFGHLPVGKLTPVDIDDFYADLLAHGGTRNQPLTTGTVARIHGVLRRGLNQAVRWEWIWTNPAIHATPPRVAHREITPPTPEAVARLLAAAEPIPGLATCLRVAATTGARRGQIVALRWSDINLTHGWISYSRSISEEPGGQLVIVPTKTRRRNRVALDAATTARLVQHREAVEHRANSAGGQAQGRRLRVLPRPRRRPPVATRLRVQAVPTTLPTQRPSRPPVPRPPPLHGHRDDQRRRPHPHRRRPPRPRPRLHHHQPLRPRRPRRRPCRRRRTGRVARLANGRVGRPAGS